MLWAFLLIAAASDWVPARWPAADPASLDLLKGSPVNCLLLESPHWSPDFSSQAAAAGIATLGLVRPSDSLDRLAERLAQARLHGAVLEGPFDPAAVSHLRATLKDSDLTLVELAPRVSMRFQSAEPILGTYQGIWPGINEAEDGSAKAAPSGAPWIDTNAGFLRFARALTTAELWIAYAPPEKNVVTLARYLQAIGDAGMVGARWVLTLDADFRKRLFASDSKARHDWQRINEALRFFERQRRWARLQPHGRLAIVQDIESGGLLSGGILDMISVRHTPVRPVPGRFATGDRLKGAQMAVNVDPAALPEPARDALRQFTRAGGTLLTAPPGWKFPPQRPDQITLDKDDIDKLDAIWKEVNSMTGRRNLGARLFNVSSMLSNLVAAEVGRPLALFLVNYSDYPVENVTAHLLGKYTKAVLHEPGAAPRTLEPYDNEEGTGVDIDKVGHLAMLVLE